jgi:hypothetical protein
VLARLTVNLEKLGLASPGIVSNRMHRPFQISTTPD